MSIVLLIVIVVILVVLVIYAIATYNGLVRRRNEVEESYRQIDVQLKRRYDLIPNLLEGVKKYFRQEQDVLTQITQARSQAMQPQSPGQQAQSEARLSGAIGNLFAVAENYPDLRSNTVLIDFQEELSSTENKISFARQHYNDSVQSYNTKIQSFPAVIFARNRRNSLLLIAAFLAFITLFGYIIGWAWLGDPLKALAGLAFALVVGVVAGLISYFAGDKMVLAASRAREITHDDAPVLFNVVEEMSIAAGLPMPKVFIVDDTAPNAFATGRDPEHAVVAVTSGLLEKLDRDELQGVISHEMSHVANFDIRYSMLVAILLAILAPLFARLLQLSISRQREFLADATAVRLTRNPRGLADALQKIGGDREVLELPTGPTPPRYIATPIKRLEKRSRGLFPPPPPIEERIQILRALESGGVAETSGQPSTETP